ncbi:uncharacterized protein Tco025E_00327 [Trypanosoma conorhini]|uniref:Uncharacterized protein n=1 Tax=Trypanosoma conorhini TaxID=83891 RepID=A0A3R7N900_9TRYP|nr:uncharacterized protein Tco025E_00327 [Trypanosoma conorhini]RNF27397.1 hypothetical protein Tco025E_00327 [Trypanosoma conorhini]
MSRRRQRGRVVTALAGVVLLLLLLAVAVCNSSAVARGPGRGAEEAGAAGPEVAGAVQIFLRVPSPVFAPRLVGERLLREYERQQRRRRRGEELQGSDNTNPVGAEEVARARRNVVSMLPADDGARPDTFPLRALTADYLREVGELLLAHLGNFIAAATHDTAPVVVDYGCRIGVALARRHPRSTVLCVYHPDDAARGFPLEAAPPLPNLIRVVARDGFLGGFAPFFTSCNFVSVSTIALPLAPLLQAGETGDGLVQLVAHALHNSGAVLAALPQLSCDALRRQWLRCVPRPVQLNADALRELQVNAVVDCDVVAEFVVRRPQPRRGLRGVSAGPDNDAGGRARLRLFRLTVRRSSRVCRKTWDAPLVQWGRAVVCAYNNSQVGYRVVQLARSNATRTADRVIHPLQYIPSVSVDSLLGMGISHYERLRLLGGMIATPRYSDPLPHNWMVGNEHGNASGGSVFRIDKVDRRFDAMVAEERNYWGRATRGYLHLLAYHLCLPLSGSGTPAVFGALDTASRQACRACVETCSYLPKGTTPCSACRLCGAAVVNYAAGNTTLDGHPRHMHRPAQVERPCARSYRSYHDAQAVWEKWRREDNRHAIEL